MTNKQALLVLWANLKLFLLHKLCLLSKFLAFITTRLFGLGILLWYETEWEWVEYEASGSRHWYLERILKVRLTKIKQL